MPVLNMNQEVERLYLPSTQNLQDDDPNKIWVDIRVGDIHVADIIEASETDTSIVVSIKMLVTRIVDWNLTNIEGAKLPVVFDTVAKMAIDDFKYLTDKIVSASDKDMKNEEKKS